MKVFDICLGLLRAILILDIAREIWDFGLVALRLFYYSQVIPESTFLMREENAGWVTNLYSLVVSCVLLALSRPMARLAARFASAEDTARPF